MKKENISAKGGGEYKFTSTSADGETETTHLSMQQLVEILHFEIFKHAESIDPNLKNVIPLDKWELELESSGLIAAIWKLGASTTESVIEYYKIHSSSVSKYIQRAVDPAITDEITKWLALRDALRDEAKRLEREKSEKTKIGSSKLPAVVRIQTSAEITGSLRAISDGATGRNWSRSKAEVALIHSDPKKHHESKLSPVNADCTYDLLEQQLREVSEPECALQSHFVFEAVLTHDRAYLELDYLIRELGWKPHSVAERQEMRVIVYKRLCLLSQLSSHGERVEMYADSITKKREKIYGFGKLIYLLDPYFTERQIKEGDNIPTGITVAAGDKLNEHRGNKKILQDIGNARRLAGLPTGQAQGDWAVSIGLALNYYWREGASRAQINRAGEENLPTPMVKKFTRKELLDMFPSVKFPVNDILESDKPKRAQVFFDGAIKLLKKKGVISWVSPPATLPRQGWQRTWLNEEMLDIRPANEAKQNVMDIAKAAQNKRKSFAKKPLTAGRTP
jgi:hypothetical protein